MSLENAKKFIERMKTDEAFKAKVMAVEDVDKRLELARAEGYDFTREEVVSVANEPSYDGADSMAGANEDACSSLCFSYCCRCHHRCLWKF